jgi:hypothetical protein
MSPVSVFVFGGLVAAREDVVDEKKKMLLFLIRVGFREQTWTISSSSSTSTFRTVPRITFTASAALGGESSVNGFA